MRSCAGTSARVTRFFGMCSTSDHAITTSSTPQQIIRQRANADTHAIGIEVEGDVRLLPTLSASVTSNVRDSRHERPPRQRAAGAATTSASTHDPRLWTHHSSCGSRGAAEDDRTLELAARFVLDVFAGRTLSRGITFVAVENLLDARMTSVARRHLTTGRAARPGVGVRSICLGDLIATESAGGNGRRRQTEDAETATPMTRASSGRVEQSPTATQH